MQGIRPSYYQHQPSTMMSNSTISRGRSLTPPSFKQNHARLSSMNHLPTQDFYPSYYPQHPAVYTDPAYYRAYGDPYLMQRFPPPPFLPLTSSPPSSSSRSYRNNYASSGLDRYPPVMSHKRTQRSRSRSRSRHRSPSSRKNRSSRERKRKRRTSSSQQRHERGPQTPPIPHRSKKRSRSGSEAAASISEQKSSSTSSSSENEANEDKQSQDNYSNRIHSKRKTKE